MFSSTPTSKVSSKIATLQPLLISLQHNSRSHTLIPLTATHVSESQKMCPLRLILIFLSATLAGFFVLRNLRSQPQPPELDENHEETKTSDSANPSLNATSKVRATLESGFWTFVDMASGRYLWRHLVSSSSKGST